MADFHFSKWRPSAILDFQKLEISTSGPIRMHNMRHRSKFREDRSNRSGDMADFRFFNMVAAAILNCGNFKFLTVEISKIQDGGSAILKNRKSIISPERFDRSPRNLVR